MPAVGPRGRRLLSGLAAALLVTTPPAQAREDVSEFIYECKADGSAVTLHVMDEQSEARLKEALARGHMAEKIDVSPLIQRTRQTSPGGSRFRGASASLIRHCGSFTVTITGGYLNVNPDGAEGIYELPVIRIAHQKGTFPPLTLGRCDASFRRFSRTTDCPMAWATEIQAALLDDKPFLSLAHQFSDQRTLDGSP